MNKQEFIESVNKIRDSFPKESLVELTENKITVSLECGGFLVFRQINIPAHLIESAPDIEKMDGQIMFQYTDDLSKSSYNNITAELFGKREPSEKIKQILHELNVRLQLGEFL